MIQIDILAVGKLREPWLRDAVDEYLKRLSRYSRIDIVECSDHPLDEAKAGEKEILHALRNEAQVLLLKLHPAACVISMDIQGKTMSSEQFARFIQDRTVQGTSRFQFIIGGSYGLDRSVLEQSHTQLSLSAMTFPHQLARVILLEQLYRACKIIHGEPYHK